MPKLLLILLISLGSLIAFTAYCMALIDWIQDYSSGLYQKSPLEVTLKTGALVAYTYFGIRFFNRNISPFS